MGTRVIDVKGNNGERSYKVSTGSEGVFWVSTYSGESIGKASSLEDSLALIKAKYGGKVWDTNIGKEYDDSCFPASSLIFTPDGWKPINEFERGDKVISLDVFSMRLSICSVTKRLDHPPAPIIQIETDLCNRSVFTTPNHPFLSKRGWLRADQLEVGEQLVGLHTVDRHAAEVTSVTRTDRIESVHNLYTSGEHNFIVDGFVVHNFARFRTIRSLWHRLFVDPPLSKNEVDTLSPSYRQLALQ